MKREVSDAETEGDEDQARLQEAASKCFGALTSGYAYRSERARPAVHQRLRATSLNATYRRLVSETDAEHRTGTGPIRAISGKAAVGRQ